MVGRLALLGVTSLVVLATCPVWCQEKVKSFPDAPSVRLSDRAESKVFVGKADGALLLGATPGVGQATRANPFLEKTIPEKGADAVFRKYLSASPQRQPSVYNGSDSEGLMGRAVHAASRTFFTRDESGKSRLNSSYFLRALTYVAADTASRPYWRRSTTGPISDFGSTVGNDAGMNLFHEFRPGIEQLMKSHAPRFVSRIEERFEQK
jgi:hypothetical protein